MPRGKKRTSGVSDYVSDNDFLDDGDQDGARKIKKARTQRAAEHVPSGSLPGGAARDEEGIEYWELSKNRRVTISQFAGKHMVGIREYYAKDDKMLPGKKGISLTLEQYSALLTALPDIEKVLKEKGQTVPRPSYADESSTRVVATDGSGAHSSSGSGPKAKAGDGTEKKRNFDATSDEADSDEEETGTRS